MELGVDHHGPDDRGSEVRGDLMRSARRQALAGSASLLLLLLLACGSEESGSKPVEPTLVTVKNCLARAGGTSARTQRVIVAFGTDWASHNIAKHAASGWNGHLVTRYQPAEPARSAARNDYRIFTIQPSRGRARSPQALLRHRGSDSEVIRFAPSSARAAFRAADACGVEGTKDLMSRRSGRR
jgi:hypothetical protein